jgi:hypothetical protein
MQSVGDGMEKPTDVTLAGPSGPGPRFRTRVWHRPGPGLNQVSPSHSALQLIGTAWYPSIDGIEPEDAFAGTVWAV